MVSLSNHRSGWTLFRFTGNRRVRALRELQDERQNRQLDYD